MLKKRISFILLISMITMLLFGCTEVTKVSIEIIEELQNILVDEVLDTDPNTNAGKVTDQDNSKQTEEVNGNLQVHFIDVGQGSSTFIIGADGKTMLYDAGGDDSGSGRIVVDYIKSLGYEHIDVAVFTHPHADHINGAPTVFEELNVGSVYYPKVTHTTKTFENFVDAVSNAGLKFKTAKAGVKIPFGETEATLVAPISDKYSNLNDYSATIKLTWKGSSILLTGDVEKTSEMEMINSDYDLDIDLLLVPHHGSNSSTTDEFLDKTTPSYAVISSGKDNSYGHPHKEVVSRLNERGIKTYNTAEDGTVIATLDGEKIDIIINRNQKN